MNNIVYVIMVENQYEEAWVERVYSSIDKAKNYLLKNYNYWVKKEDKNPEDEKEINEITTENLLNSDFYVDLQNRGVLLTLSAKVINEEYEII